MKYHWKITLLLLTIIALTTLAFSGQKQDKNAEDPDVTQFPVVDYKIKKSNDSLESTKQQKSKKYNSRHAPVITESTDKILRIDDWELRLPALPVARSAAIIIGEITNAEANLSDDQTKIYCEFTVHINKVLKNDDQVPLGAGALVTVERSGGRVRFPSGKIAVSVVAHQDLPRIGKRYVLFLTHDAPNGGESEDLAILTGYELRDGLVFPLDKPVPGHPILAYTGISETSLLNDLADALTSLPLTQSK